jgi:two-component system, cell cycle sensor histidine kinase and response regulator CckA
MPRQAIVCRSDRFRAMRRSSWQIQLILLVVSILTTLVIVIVVLRFSSPPALAFFVSYVVIPGPLVLAAFLALLIGGPVEYRLKRSARHCSATRSTPRYTSEAQNQFVAERATDVIALTDEAGRICYASPSFQAILGYAPASAIGVRALTLIHPDDVSTTSACFGCAHRRGTRGTAFRLRHADGSWRWFEADATYVSDNDQRRLMIIGRDITERKRLEAELRQLQKLDTIGRLTGGVIHDFNNLLTGIAGFAELGLSGLPSAHPVREDLDEIARAAARAATLTNQLLLFARKQIAAPRNLDLNTLIVDMDKLLRRLIGAQIVLSIQPDPEPAWVYADASQIEQVLVNLVVNARDAMPDGGTLTINTANVTLDASTWSEGSCPAGRYVQLIVRDVGMGIDPATQQHLFEPFFTTKAPHRGTGLGLATCADIVRQHRGAISISSEPGCGTSVTVYLPQVAAVDREDSGGVASFRPLTSSLPHGTETVLLVEDENAVRVLAARTLRSLGYTVLEAADGAAALEAIERHSNAPLHLLLTDITMPYIGGGSLADRLAQQYPNLAVIFMSGHRQESLVEDGRLGPDALFLQKPFSRAELARMVRAALEAQAARASPVHALVG